MRQRQECAMLRSMSTPQPPTSPPPASSRAAKGIWGDSTTRIGVLLVNLGTPDATDYWSMRRYLKEFLSDRRVIETNRVLWWFILNAIILTVRPGPKGRDYESIWNKERNEGPLLTITRAQAEKLSPRMAGLDPRIRVDFAMRYGNPSIASRIKALEAEGCARILVVPLYPQYAAATTATVGDAVFDALKTMRRQPAIRIAPPWQDHPVYIEALAQELEHHLAALDFEPEVILASFHGIPKSYVDRGDPYPEHCRQTMELLRARMGMDEQRLRLTFQSRFGKEEWLTPYTDETVKALGDSGVKRLAVLTPGFVADCLETLEEIGGENREYFLEHGGEQFAAIPCLNDTPAGMDVLEAVVRQELAGWVHTTRQG
ncbi:ferrochelatase [Xanthobacter sp. TB0136]|uniref:ferrochelatase n=1 Tax=Xanthobacter sp. TB0136 TaxID=3459177 RepID=UPI00403A4C4D